MAKWTDGYIEACREMCLIEKNLFFFTCLMFEELYGEKLLKNWHQYIFSDLAKKVYDGEITRLIINVAPGSGKTLFWAQCFIALGLAINPSSRYLQSSYSDDLVNLNSNTVKEIIRTELYQALFPDVVIQLGSDSKGWWKTTRQGGMRAASMGSAITGFRAGHLSQKGKFSGAIVLDDPTKVEDAFSRAKSESSNRKITSTVDSRVAHSDIPVILIQQRISTDDATSYVLSHYSENTWTQVKLPAIIDREYIEQLPEHIRSKAITNQLIDDLNQDNKGRFSYWEYKESLSRLLETEQFNSFVFAGQYQQEPRLLDGNLIKTKWYGTYYELPRFKARAVFADTAQKIKEENDYSVFIHAGLGYDNRLYLIDLLRGKWQSVKLEETAVTFWNKAQNEHSGNGDMRGLFIEDKSSGTDLINRLSMQYHIPVHPVPKLADKFQTCMSCQVYLENGLVMLPDDAEWKYDFILESEIFDGKPSTATKKDDQMDTMFMAILEMLAKLVISSAWDVSY